MAKRGADEMDNGQTEIELETLDKDRPATLGYLDMIINFYFSYHDEELVVSAEWPYHLAIVKKIVQSLGLDYKPSAKHPPHGYMITKPPGRDPRYIANTAKTFLREQGLKGDLHRFGALLVFDIEKPDVYNGLFPHDLVQLDGSCDVQWALGTKTPPSGWKPPPLKKKRTE